MRILLVGAGGVGQVTANKAVMALDFDRLHQLAQENGRSLRYSATIGGGVPILEIVDLLAAEDSLEFYDGLEFYAWLAEEEGIDAG